MISLHVKASWTPAEQEAARADDGRTHSALKKLCRQPSNSECADCRARFPGWAALPWGAHVCIDCAQVHRKIGRHISQVKAINTGTYLWHRDELEAMATMGNAKIERLMLGGAAAAGRLGRCNKAPPRKPARTDEKYIRDKYERKLWFDSALTWDELQQGRGSGGGAKAEDKGTVSMPARSRAKPAKNTRRIGAVRRIGVAESAETESKAVAATPDVEEPSLISFGSASRQPAKQKEQEESKEQPHTFFKTSPAAFGPKRGTTAAAVSTGDAKTPSAQLYESKTKAIMSMYSGSQRVSLPAPGSRATLMGAAGPGAPAGAEFFALYGL